MSFHPLSKQAGTDTYRWYTGQSKRKPCRCRAELGLTAGMYHFDCTRRWVKERLSEQLADVAGLHWQFGTCM